MVSAGSYHTCAVKTTGTLWCWGNNGLGQLGDDTITNRLLPIREGTIATNWATVSAGASYTCAVKTSGTLWCWGHNGFGQLGDGTTVIDRLRPTQEGTAVSNWATVSAKASHTCAVRTSGTLWCWGHNFRGEIGSGAGGPALPEPVHLE
jgi:alpha-tubulin suppressor-like RCC1 family protein